MHIISNPFKFMMSTTSETRIVYDQTYLEDKCWPPRPVDPKRADDQYVYIGQL